MPARWLLIDDAPWLEGRLNPAKLHLAHALLLRPSENIFVGNATSKRYGLRDDTNSGNSSQSEDLLELLGVKSLSRIVEERLALNFAPLTVSPQPPPLLLWNEALKSSALRHGLRQLIKHEEDEFRVTGSGMMGEALTRSHSNQTGGQKGINSSGKSVMERLLELESVTLVGCRGLETAFWVNGQDITAPPLHHASTRNSLADDSTQIDPRGGGFGSSFLLIADAGSGTTADAAAAVASTRKLFIDVSSEGGSDRLWLNYVVLALKQNVLGGMPRDLLPFAMMLDAVGSSLKRNRTSHSSSGSDEVAARAAVGSVLKSHHIADRRFSDHLGLPLPHGAVTRLVSASQLLSNVDGSSSDGRGSMCTLFAIGEEVAFQDQKMPLSSQTRASSLSSESSGSSSNNRNHSSETGGSFRYGRVVRWVDVSEDFPNGSYTIEDSPRGTSRQVQLSDIFKLHLPPGALQAHTQVNSSHVDATDSVEFTTATTSNPVRASTVANAANGAFDEHELEALKVAAASANTVNRVRYTPPDEEWASKEASLVRALREEDDVKQRLLEEEVPGTNKVLVKSGFTSPSLLNSSTDELEAAARSLGDVTVAKARPPSVRKGMDLVRVGNLGDSGVAFFFDRRSMPPPPFLLKWLETQVFPTYYIYSLYFLNSSSDTMIMRIVSLIYFLQSHVVMFYHAFTNQTFSFYP